MSIKDVILAAEGTSLWRFEPKLRSSLKRRLYLTMVARRQLLDSGSIINVLGGRGYVQSALVHWVSGGRIRADEKGKPRFLKRLSPPPSEIWEIRVTDPHPQYRLLGRIVERDTLVLAQFHTRPHLGARGSKAWKEEMAACDDQLSQVFGNTSLMMKSSISDYVTENFDEFKLCAP